MAEQNVRKMPERYTMHDVCVVMSDVIANVREGSMPGAVAQVIVNASGKIVAATKLEADLMKMAGRQKDAARLLGAGAGDDKDDEDKAA